MLNSGDSPVLRSGPEPMDIGNMETIPRYHWKEMQNKTSGLDENGEKKNEMANNACFVCYEGGCGAWKHEDEKLKAISAGYSNDAFPGSELENCYNETNF